MGKANHRKSTANTKNYMKTQMRENHGEKFHYDNGDYNDVLWCARVFRLN